MERFLITLVTFAPSTACIAGAIYLAAQDKAGWGWFLLAAVVVAGSVKFGGGR